MIPNIPARDAAKIARRRLLGAGGVALATMLLRAPREAGFAQSTTAEATPTTVHGGADSSCLAASRTGEQLGSGPVGAPVERWRVPIGAGDARPAVLGGDAVFVADNDGALRALDAATGQERWHDVPPGGATGVAVVGTTVLIGGDDLVAYDAATGDVRWQAALAASVTAPVACGDVAQVGGAQGVFGIDVATGAERWRFLTGTSMGAPAARGNAIAVLSDDGVLYVLDAVSGHERWSVGIGSGPPPVLASDAVVIVTERGALGERHGTLMVFDLDTGAERWRVELPSRINAAPATSGGLVFLGTGGDLVAFDSATGAERWRFEAGDFLATPALAGETLYLAAGSGGPVDGTATLFALDAANGTEHWRFWLPYVLVSSPVVANGVVYVSCADPYVGGTIVAIGSS